MPNVRMTSAQMKAKAKVAAAKNKAKSKSPNKKKGTAKKTSAPKTEFKYEKIKSTSTYKPKMVKDDNKNLKAADLKDKKAKKNSPAKMSGRSYDAKEAYNKNLTPKARLHYLENERHDAVAKKKGSPYHMSNELKYGGPVIDQMKSLSQASSFKVLKHMKSKI